MEAAYSPSMNTRAVPTSLKEGVPRDGTETGGTCRVQESLIQSNLGRAAPV